MGGKIQAYLWLLPLGIVLAIVFQNCGEIRPSKEAMKSQASAELRIRNDRETLRRVFGSGNLKVWISAKEAELDSVTQRVIHIASRGLSGLALSPSGFVMGPTLHSFIAGAKTIQFSPGAGLSTSDTVSSTTYSAIFLVEGEVSGKILSISSGSTNVEELAIAVESGILTAAHFSTANDLVTRSQPLEAKSGMRAIAVSFAEAAEGISVLIDGKIVRSAVRSVGSPTPSVLIPRNFIIGDAAASFRIVETMVLSEALRPSELNTFSRYLAESWGYDGVIYDPALEPEAEEGENPDRVPANVMAILESKCTSCHAHTNWVGSKSFFVGQGLVVPGSYLSSKLYNRLIGSEGSNSNKNMPVGGTMAPEELETIKSWIQNL